MQILNKLFGPQTRNIQRAMDRVSLRQSVLAGNLANINTPGYKRRDVDFAIELEKAGSLFSPVQATGSARSGSSLARSGSTATA